MHSYFIANMLRNTSEMVQTHQTHQSVGFVRLYFYTGIWTLYFGPPCKEESLLWTKLLYIVVTLISFPLRKTPVSENMRHDNKSIQGWKPLRREHEFRQLPTLKQWGYYKSCPWNAKVKGGTSCVLATAFSFVLRQCIIHRQKRASWKDAPNSYPIPQAFSTEEQT